MNKFIKSITCNYGIFHKKSLNYNKHPFLINKTFFSNCTITLNKNQHSDFFIKNIKLNNTKHFVPATKEWTDSTYTFNKNNSNDSTVKFNQLNNIIKNYFNISNKLKLSRSKRLRYSRAKRKSKRVYLGKPEIKQNNDKIIITIHCLDRTNQRLTRKLFYFNRPEIYKKLETYKKKRKMVKMNKKVKHSIPLSGIKNFKEIKLLKYKNFIKNKHLEQITRFQFIKYLLSLLGIGIIIPMYFNLPIYFENNNKLRYYYTNTRKTKRINHKMILETIKTNPKIIYWINHTTNVIEKIEKENININLLRKYLREHKYINKKRLNEKIIFMSPSNIITEINKKLWSIINKDLDISYINLLKIHNNVFTKLSIYSMRHIYKRQAKKIIKLMDLSGYNLLKFKVLLPSLKKFIDNLYNKNTELNIVNLKYYYLNSEIFTQILISKIRKNITTVRVLKNSIKKIKTHTFSFVNKQINKFNNIKLLPLNSNLSLKNLPNNSYYTNKKQDKLNDIYKKLYTNNLIFNKSTNNITKNNINKSNKILSMIKYKWLLGIWVEAKGRLTRRNTAARSLSLSVFKGSLKDKDQHLYLNSIKSIPTYILRNNERSNEDYTYKGSVKRTGTFGIKTWINTK